MVLQWNGKDLHFPTQAAECQGVCDKSVTDHRWAAMIHTCNASTLRMKNLRHSSTFVLFFFFHIPSELDSGSTEHKQLAEKTNFTVILRKRPICGLAAQSYFVNATLMAL